jgi:uncharacterized protein (DUF4415 family)
MPMSKPPNRYRPIEPRTAAEAAFKKATTKPADPTPAPKKTSLPIGRELVSLRIDRDVLEHFQEGGLGWQDRINQALRKASGLDSQATHDEGTQPDQLASKND